MKSNLISEPNFLSRNYLVHFFDEWLTNFNFVGSLAIWLVEVSLAPRHDQGTLIPETLAQYFEVCTLW